MGLDLPIGCRHLFLGGQHLQDRGPLADVGQLFFLRSDRLSEPVSHLLGIGYHFPHPRLVLVIAEIVQILLATILDLFGPVAKGNPPLGFSDRNRNEFFLQLQKPKGNLDLLGETIQDRPLIVKGINRKFHFIVSIFFSYMKKRSMPGSMAMEKPHAKIQELATLTVTLYAL